MEQRLSDAKDTATELRERLSNLWERLQISSDQRESFLHAHRGYSNPTINAVCTLNRLYIMSSVYPCQRCHLSVFLVSAQERIEEM